MDGRGAYNSALDETPEPRDSVHAAAVASLKETASELQARPPENMNRDWADRMVEGLAQAGLLAGAVTENLVLLGRRAAQPAIPGAMPNQPGDRDHCTVCNHMRWRHHDGVCTEYLNCRCNGEFAEPKGVI